MPDKVSTFHYRLVESITRELIRAIMADDISSAGMSIRTAEGELKRLKRELGVE